jgi:succinyl-CoA synthetase beta subunit
MKIHEYQARILFEQKKIPVPRGKLCTTSSEVRTAAQELGKPVVIKSQILVAGRGKAGGIRLAQTPSEAEEIAKKLIGSVIKGIKVNSVLVVESVEPKQELYLGFTIDRSARKFVLIASSQGGMDLEELALTQPDKIFRREIEPLIGLHDFEARLAADSIGLGGRTATDFSSICKKIFAIFCEVEADLAESNPLAVTYDGSLVALDSRITLDDNALFRHPEYRNESEDMSPLEREASQQGLAFVQLDGDIGIIGNGAGLVMATLDVVSHYGGRPANFLDMGGGSSSDVVFNAVSLALKQTNLKALFVNVLGGITRCDDVARGLVKALKGSQTKVPVIVRMVGNNEEEGRKILADAGVATLDSMEDAAKLAVQKAYT